MRPTTKSLLALTVLTSCSAAVGCEARKSPVEPSPVCVVAITPSSASFGEQGGAGSVTVTTTAGCSWSASAGAEWIGITSGRTGDGPGSVAYAVAANGGPESRTAAIAIEDQRHTITQSGSTPLVCTFRIDPHSADFSKDAAAGEFTVDAPASCGWTASSAVPWLAVAAGGQGSGPGRVSYTVARNTAIDTRTAAIAVADRVFTVRQGGDTGICTYAVTPVEFQPCMTAGALSAAITTDASCPWTATSTAPWLNLESGSNGSGSSTVRFAFSENYDAPRSGVIEVRWPTPTAGQNIRVIQAGCRYGVSQAQFAIAASGGASTFNVVQQSDPLTCGGATQDRCVWSARSDVDWITVTTSMPRSGDDRVSFVTAANPGASSRVGRIAVRDQTVTVTQAGR
jgi:hypothetical protein